MKVRNLIAVSVFCISAIALYVFSGIALAQDPTKVSPDVYKLLHERNNVRILEMKLKPGQQDSLHSHPFEVVYFAKPCQLTITLPDNSTVDAEFKQGDVLEHEAWTHKVKNIGKEETLMLIVEFKEAKKDTSSSEK